MSFYDGKIEPLPTPTKTLTEQWREGMLPVGSYYINLVGDVERVDFFGGLEFERTKAFGIEEVLAPVPSYDEYKRLQEQLKEANEAIDEAYWDCYNEGFEPELATEYRKKYGLNANDEKYKQHNGKN